MVRLIRSPRVAEWGSAALVVVASLVVGRYAAIGMSPEQWACGVFSVLGSVGVAVMVRAWPAPQRAE
ncbi:MAG TPA: hypothetical protein VL460_08070 [Caulobacteraceae bacterium]|jgi:hypothetical protein|nr:hypothetical protein [Caulobacteraceae bacterium]